MLGISPVSAYSRLSISQDTRALSANALGCLNDPHLSRSFGISSRLVPSSVVITRKQHRAKIEELRVENSNQFSCAGTSRALLVIKELGESVRGAMH